MIKGQSEAKLLNEIYGNVKILSFSHILEKYKKFYNTLCLNCNKESIRRIDRIKTNNTYCRHCKDIETSKLRIKNDTPFNALYSIYRNNAVNRNIIFNLTKEYFIKLCKQNCYYCGDLPIENKTSKRNNNSDVPCLYTGVDRIDSKIGYEIDNCIPCCSICNIMKNKFSKDIFFNKIKDIYNKHLKECSTTISKESTL